MKKIIYRFSVGTITLILIGIIYLSTIGVKTEKFNSEISSQIKKIDKNLDIKLKKVSIILNPAKLEINTKTVGADLVYRNNIIQLENIKSNISIKSLINGKFLLTSAYISTKSLDLKNLISFIRFIKKDPKIYIAEQFIKKGYVIADIEVKFDELGKIKENYKINGLVKDAKVNYLKTFDLNKIDFIFNIKKNNFKINDLKFTLNNKDILIPKLIVIEKNNEFSVSGKINNEDIVLNKDNLDDFFEEDLFGVDIKEINFKSKNSFNFNLNKKFKIKDLNIDSEIDLSSLKFNNPLEISKFFPKAKKEIELKNHKIKLNYNKNDLNINGSGNILLQEQSDKIEYQIFKNENGIKYNSNLTIKKNLFNIDLLNFTNDKETDLNINVSALKNNKKDLVFENISLKKKDNIIIIKNLHLSKDNKIDHIESIKTNFIDNENFRNKIQVLKDDENYTIKGDSFNINKIVDNFLDLNDKKKLILFNKNFKINLDIKKIYLDKENTLNNLSGYIYLQNSKIFELDLISNFPNKKNIKLTIKNEGNKQVTTLFSNKAKPLVDRYRFIKGFKEGYLDFYSVKKNNHSKSILKIYDFKLKELPVLTKILTLASLQGVADLLSGEGIRFNEFEMSFSNKDNLMTIDEIYSIGPAISILMDGYIEKNKLISLRGTLVPATTINKTIGSIPILGDILVGKKTGEGVFGVSFKIKGPPENLETSVNPVKTLTPRFITRTLEKIKKN